VGILDNSFIIKLGYLILLNYLISFLIYNLSNSVYKGIDVSVNSEFSYTNNS
jgi:hypothetical protein